MGGLRLTAGCMLALLLLQAPFGAMAGVNVDQGPFRIVVEDERGTDCGALSGACLFGVWWEGGVLHVDTQQNVSYAGAAVDVPVAQQANFVLYPLLPDDGIVVEPSKVILEHPLMQPAQVVLDNQPALIHDLVRVHREEQKIGVETYYFSPIEPGKGVHRSNRTFGFANGTVGLTEVRPFYGQYLFTTDMWRESFVGRGCTLEWACAPEAYKVLDDLWRENLPVVHWGFHLQQAHVASDPAHLRIEGGQEGLRESAGGYDLGSRDAAGDPLPSSGEAGPLPVAHVRREPQALPVPTAGWGIPEAATRGVETQATQSTPSLTDWAIVSAAAASALALLALLGLGLYARIRTRHQAENHPMRARILDVLRQRPALSPTDLAPMLDITRNATLHHVRILERAGLVRVERRERRTFLFAAGAQPGTATAEVICRLVRDDPVFDLLKDTPHGLTRHEVRASLPQLPSRTRNHRLQRLVERGIVRLERDGSEERYVLIEPLREHLHG